MLGFSHAHRIPSSLLIFAESDTEVAADMEDVGASWRVAKPLCTLVHAKVQQEDMRATNRLKVFQRQGPAKVSLFTQLFLTIL